MSLLTLKKWQGTIRLVNLDEDSHNSQYPMQHIPWFTQKTIVVTGAAGFIGSHLVEALLQAGAQVIGVDNFITGQKINLASVQSQSGFRFIEADCSQPAELYLPSDVAIDAVLHFASPASPPRYQAHPVETYQVNAWGTHYLLEYLKAHHPDARLLFASTSEVYGDPAMHPQPESYWGNVNPNGLRSCYDESKRLGETICGVAYRSFQFDTRIVRIFNTYGPRMDAIDGRIIPNFVNQALNKKELTIYGDGSQTRSLCHVDDLVEGILIFLAQANVSGETINLGNDEEFTAIEIARQIWDSIHPGETPTFTYHPIPEDDPVRRRPDLTKARRLLGWQPRIDFKTGVRSVIDYFAQTKIDISTV